jgi:hypothetical protein
MFYYRKTYTLSLGLGEECASAVGAGRRRRYHAMKVEGDF